MMTTERDRFKHALEQDPTASCGNATNQAYIHQLKQSLAEVRPMVLLTDQEVRPMVLLTDQAYIHQLKQSLSEVRPMVLLTDQAYIHQLKQSLSEVRLRPMLTYHTSTS